MKISLVVKIRDMVAVDPLCAISTPGELCFWVNMKASFQYKHYTISIYCNGAQKFVYGHCQETWC